MSQSLRLGLIAALLLTSCALHKREVLPQLVPMPDAAGPRQQCSTSFPQGRWQLVHAIGFRMADGTSGNVLGVLVLGEEEIRCALMTVEGLTLFEARTTGGESMEVLRALPPFDTPAFAAGLMGDVRTLFQPPPGLTHYGALADGTPVCRASAGDTVTDILPQADGCWQMHTYSEQPGHQPLRTRTITARSCSPVGPAILPRTLELIAAGPTGYTLTLRLLSAEPLSASPCMLP